MFNNTWSGDHKAYQAAAMGAKGRTFQSYHRDMMKVPDGKRAVSVFAALDEDLYSVDGTDTVFLPHSREGLPRPYGHCFGDRLFLLCHPHCLLTMASDSMALPVSYMRSLCKKDRRIVRHMVLSPMQHGVAEKIVHFCAGLRVNKRSRATLDRIRRAVARKQWPRWLTNYAYYVWRGVCRMHLPQGAVASGETTIAVMWADCLKLVHAGLTEPSWMSIADQDALHFRKLRLYLRLTGGLVEM